MAYGKLIADGVVVITDAAHGKPVVETAEPTYVPSGYVSKGVWVETDTQLMLVYDVVPAEGTAEEAALALSRMQYQSLPESVAYELRALAPEYVPGESYAAGFRFRSNGALYRADDAFVAPQGLAPDADEVPATELRDPATATEWRQPADKHTYGKGSLVTHGGRLWRSLKNNNEEEPGTGKRWEEVA